MTATARPRWRRWAGAARRASWRIATLVDPLVHPRRGALLPPAHLRIYYYRTWRPARFHEACDGIAGELLSRGLQPHHRVLDIGSGIGNLALGLTEYLRGGYDGIEVHPEAVAWCQRAITPRHPSFRFHRADVANLAYNPGGSVGPADYRFPFNDGSFDFMMLSSVFTHMLPGEVAHYIREIARLLSTGGTCVASFFLLNDERRSSVEQGRSFMAFGVAHPSGLCRLHDAAVPESAVAIEEDFVRRILDEAGLRIDHIRRGEWWSGKAHDQDVLAIVAEHHS